MPMPPEPCVPLICDDTIAGQAAPCRDRNEALRQAAKVMDIEGGGEPIHRRQVLEEIFCREGEH